MWLCWIFISVFCLICLLSPRALSLFRVRDVNGFSAEMKRVPFSSEQLSVTFFPLFIVWSPTANFPSEHLVFYWLVKRWLDVFLLSFLFPRSTWSTDWSSLLSMSNFPLIFGCFLLFFVSCRDLVFLCLKARRSKGLVTCGLLSYQ